MTIAGLVATLGTACGDEGGTVEVTHPPAGAEVGLPFQVTIDTGVPLGAPEEDLHHVHIWFADDLESYLVVETTTVEIVNAPVGEHEMHVSLRNPDHTSAGAETSVPLVIG